MPIFYKSFIHSYIYLTKINAWLWYPLRIFDKCENHCNCLWVRDSRPRAKPHSKNVINLKKVSFLPLSYIVRQTKCKYMVMSTCIIPLFILWYSWPLGQSPWVGSILPYRENVFYIRKIFFLKIMKITR